MQLHLYLPQVFVHVLSQLVLVYDGLLSVLDIVVSYEMLDKATLAEIKVTVLTEVLQLEVRMFLTQVGSIRIHFSY